MREKSTGKKRGQRDALPHSFLTSKLSYEMGISYAGGRPRGPDYRREKGDLLASAECPPRMKGLCRSLASSFRAGWRVKVSLQIPPDDVDVVGNGNGERADRRRRPPSALGQKSPFWRNTFYSRS